jgi:putative glutamine amidotransferase
MAAGRTLENGQGLSGGPRAASAPPRVPPLRVGMSARLLHNLPPEIGFRGKTLQYLEQSLAHWIMAQGALAFMLPTLESGGGVDRGRISLGDYVREIDALVLQGGADLCPASYGEEPLRPEWSGDRQRDLYELDLFWECVIQGKPVLGICRGAQLINVALGGTLWQDIVSQVPGSIAHVDAELYDRHVHKIDMVQGSRLSRIYGGIGDGEVISIHHQAVKELGGGLVVEAHAEPDGTIEAIRWTGDGHVVGVQWHPEFHRNRDDSLQSRLLDGGPLLLDFLDEARRRRAARA